MQPLSRYDETSLTEKMEESGTRQGNSTAPFLVDAPSQIQTASGFQVSGVGMLLQRRH